MIDFYEQERTQGGYSTFNTTGQHPVQVFYKIELDGGGSTFGQDYLPVLKNKYPDKVFDRAYEWCAGPGFIGFSLLSHGICRTLCLSDLYDPAVTAAEVTINYRPNRCQDLVTAYLCKDVGLIPKHEQFDLVVANPPHFNDFDGIPKNDYTGIRISKDINWRAHRNFFNNIKPYLKADGVILLQEHIHGAKLTDLVNMIESNGLQITDHYDSPNVDQIAMYYIEIQHASAEI
jgi:methylase of polypeptide subunit release factors